MERACCFYGTSLLFQNEQEIIALQHIASQLNSNGARVGRRVGFKYISVGSTIKADIRASMEGTNQAREQLEHPMKDGGTGNTISAVYGIRKGGTNAHTASAINYSYSVTVMAGLLARGSWPVGAVLDRYIPSNMRNVYLPRDKRRRSERIANQKAKKIAKKEPSKDMQ